jgi:PAS domain S-box-containing protein
MENPVVESLPKGSIASTKETLIHVLYVDDEVGLLKVAKPILEMQGSFRVETVSSVEEAMEKMEEKTFDVIVCDYIMPGKDGLEFLKELRDSGNSISFIIFTGKGREIVAIKALNLGADQYINKIGKPEAVYSELAHGIRTVVKGKKAEEALKKAKEKFETYLNLASVMMIAIDAEGIVTYVNKKSCEILKCKEEEIVGKDWFSNFLPERLRKKIKAYSRQLLSGQIKPVAYHENPVLTKDGEERLIGWHNTLLRDNAGKIIGHLSSGEDITKRKEAEEKLQASEKSWSASFSSLEDVMIIIDKDFTIEKINDSGLKLLGKTREEVMGKKCYQAIHYLDAPCEFCPYERTLKTGKLEPVERYIELFDKYFSIKSSPIFNERGKIVGFVDLMRDVTERKRMENVLRESEEKYRSMIEQAPDLIVTIDEKGIVTSCNPALERGTDYSQHEIIGKHFIETPLLHGIDPAYAQRLFNAIIEEKHPDPIELTWFLKDGTPRISEVRIGLMKKEGKIAGFTAVARDITERKEAEERLRASEKSWSDSFNSLEDVMIIIDKDFTIEKMNDNGLKLLGKTREEVTGKKCYQVVHGLDAPGDFCPLKRTLKTGKVESVDMYEELFGKYFGIKSSPIFNERGETIGFVDLMRDITEQKKAEEALRRSEEEAKRLLEFQNKVIDTAMVWVNLLDLKGNVILWNRAAELVSGYSREEVIGHRKMWKWLYPDPNYRANIFAIGKEISERGKRLENFYSIIRCKDGSLKTISWYATNILDEKGKPAGTIAVGIDVTESKKMEEKIRASEEKYRSLVELAPDSIMTFDMKGMVTSINTAAARMSGYSKDEFVGKHFTKIGPIRARDIPKYLKMLTSTVRGKVPKPFEVTYRRKDGTSAFGEVRFSLMREKNKIIGIQAIMRDISERKQAEKALREAEKKYRKTILKANVGIIGYDAEGKVKVLNPKMWQMTGFKRSEIPTLQDWFKKLYPNKEERRKIRDKWLKRMSEEGEVQGGHAIITTKDGKRRNFLFNGVRLESGDFIAFADDITERKEAEEKLDEMMNELVAINEKLGVVGKLTRHDARNKLSVIANNVYLAKQRLAADHTTLEYLGDIESAIDQMEELFDFAKTYEMLGIEELSYMNVEKSVNEAAILFSGLSSVKLVNECQGLTVMADSLLRQLFYNLIDDTLKHGEKVSQIRVYCKEGEDQLKLIYEDDGIGVPNDEKEKIFNEGYGKGTGYGLYLIKKICEAYGWTIRETGKSGKGAQFTIGIPKMNKNGKISYIIN